MSDFTIGIVLKIKKHSENEFIVYFLCAKGVLKLFAMGLEKPTSKNKTNLVIGAIVEIEYFKARLKNKIGRLKTVKTLLFPVYNFKSLEEYFEFQKLIKLFLTINFENNFLSVYKFMLEKLKYINYEYAMTYFYGQLLINYGVCPNFKSCAICMQESNLVSFNLEEGGFFCNKHSDEIEILNVEVLNLIYLSYNNFILYVQKTNKYVNDFLQNKYKEVLQNAGFAIY